MKDVVSDEDATASRQACLEVARALIAQYGWSLLLADELAQRVLCSSAQPATLAALKQAAKHEYALALYDACRPAADPERRRRAYTDLSRYLFRVASSSWPDLAAEIADRALFLTCERFETCEHPGAFLVFAVWQARRALKEIVRRQRKELSLEEIIAAGGEPAQPPDMPRFDPDCLRALVEALRRVPERQRQVIALKYFEGLSDDAIGARIGQSVGNVRVMRNRGMSRLRSDTLLREICGDAHPPL